MSVELVGTPPPDEDDRRGESIPSDSEDKSSRLRQPLGKPHRARHIYHTTASHKSLAHTFWCANGLTEAF